MTVFVTFGIKLYLVTVWNYKNDISTPILPRYFRPGEHVLADVNLAVKGLISQGIIDTLKRAVESGVIGKLRVEVVPGMIKKSITLYRNLRQTRYFSW